MKTVELFALELQNLSWFSKRPEGSQICVKASPIDFKNRRLHPKQPPASSSVETVSYL